MEVAGHTCCELRLRSCGWTAHHMREFAVALPHFAKLQFLDLGQNDLHDEAAKILATVLKAPFCLVNSWNSASERALIQSTSLAEVRPLFCVVDRPLCEVNEPLRKLPGIISHVLKEGDQNLH